MSLDLRQLYETFFDESFEALDVMESTLLHVDLDALDDETLSTIFRTAHTLKDSSGTLEFHEITALTHMLETLMDEVCSGQRPLTRVAVDLLLQAVDCLRDMLADSRAGRGIDQPRVLTLQEQFFAVLQERPGSAPTVTATAPPEQATGAGWRVTLEPGLVTQGTTRAEERVVSIAMDPEPCVFSALSPRDSSPVVVEEGGIHRNDGEPRRGRDRRATGAPVESSSVRVSTDKIDALINMVGELVITQAMLNQLGEDFTIERLDKLRDGLDQLDRNTRELQESVMRIRMLPISVVFQRFPRLVHDLSQQLGKQVELRLSGEQTEIDKTVLEKIGDPLMHLVRNSLDHGIEDPATRQAAGKPTIGTIQLHAYHQRGHIIIEVGDDGAGLQRGTILRKARAQGLIGSAEEVNDEKLFELIFHPGFSTAAVVSDISGRGVGMDVVRRNVKGLGGTIEVRSQAGRDTMFTIRLPLTLAILDGQLVRVGQHVFIIPLVSIIESLQIESALLHTIAGQAELYQFRDLYLPILRLDALLHLGADTHELVNALLAVVEGDGQRVGLVVDELLGQQQVVIKSLETNYKRVEGISGATILGDGSVSLILDVAGLISLSKRYY